MSFTNISNIWPEWQIIGVLGHGRNSVVYEALRYENSAAKYSSIKVISLPCNELFDEKSEDGLSELIKNFEYEMSAWKSLNGETNIVTLDDYRLIPDTNRNCVDIYIKTETLTPLSLLMNSHFAQKDILKIGLDICCALEKCEEKGIYHCDIRPENIFVDQFGNYKLGDFGTSLRRRFKTKSPGDETLFYLPPEIINDADISEKNTTDIYSVAMILYRMLNNNTIAFVSSPSQMNDKEKISEAENLRISLSELPVPSDAGEKSAKVILKALAPLSENRFQSAGEFKNVLSDAYYDIAYRLNVSAVNKDSEKKETKEITAPETENAVSADKNKKQNNTIIVIVTALIVCVLIAGSFFGVRYFRNSVRSESTESEITSLTDEHDKAVDDIEKLAKAGDYEYILKLIDESLENYPDSFKLRSLKRKYTLWLEEKEKLIAQAEDFYKAKDYLSAVDTVKNGLDFNSEDKDYNKLYEKYSEKYEDKIISQADEYLKNKEYSKALKVLSDAQWVVGKSARLNEKIKEIESTKN